MHKKWILLDVDFDAKTVEVIHGTAKKGKHRQVWLHPFVTYTIDYSKKEIWPASQLETGTTEEAASDDIFGFLVLPTADPQQLIFSIERNLQDQREWYRFKDMADPTGEPYTGTIFLNATNNPFVFPCKQPQKQN